MLELELELELLLQLHLALSSSEQRSHARQNWVTCSELSPELLPELMAAPSNKRRMSIS